MGDQNTIDHLRELVRERDDALRDAEIERTRLVTWIRDHARHAEDCEKEPCTCGLEDLKRDP